jgi:hypothetical protein
MAKIPPPKRGQPLDLSYIAEITNAINELSSEITTSSSKYFSVDTPKSGTQKSRVADSRIIGGYLEISTNADVVAGSEKSFIYNFSENFKYPPVVTATAINVGGTQSGKNVSIILRAVSNSTVEGFVRFNEGGNLTVGINIIAVGIPS